MLRVFGDRHDHEKFKRLCALAASGNLTPFEAPELETHLQECQECHQVLLQYRVLTTEGIAALAESYADKDDRAKWDGGPALRSLLAQVRMERRSISAQRPGVDPVPQGSTRQHFLRREEVKSFARMALAACFVIVVGVGAYRLGAQKHLPRVAPVLSPVSDDRVLEKLASDKNAADELLAKQAAKLIQLQLESSEKERELNKLRSALQALRDHSDQAVAASSQSATQSQTLAQERDALNSKLQAMSQSFEQDRLELASLRAERDQTALRTSSLEKQISDLTATNRDQERRLRDSDKYLTSDRDIRELMGARKLYIADVFDVDGSSRTKKPFGRVFYTQGKSLIFYAFDLDREPGVVNASAFQVWGQKETPQGEQASPMNLGILYMDNETNRRWVMRFDEPRQLAEIDAVFVTVEPRGGSHKPTTKPFLYALLRNEANHP
jgi:hypothetical protein